MKAYSNRTIVGLAFVSLLLLSCATAPKSPVAGPEIGPLPSAELSPEPGKLLFAASPELVPLRETRDFLDLVSPGNLKLIFKTDVLETSGYPAWRKSRRSTLVDVVGVRLAFLARRPEGGMERQSGMLFLPAADPKAVKALTWVVSVKGTEQRREAVPSRGKGNEILFQKTMAALGYAVWAPDYSGMGDGEGIQDYCVPESLAASGLDGLQAARAWLAKAQIGGKRAYSETGRMAIIGYSEGGLAAMAILKALVEGEIPAPGLRVSAAYPMGAPLNLNSGLPYLREKPTLVTHPDYFVLLVLGWARSHPDSIRVEDIALPRTLERILPLFDGSRSGTEIRRDIALIVGKKPGAVLDTDLFREDYLVAMRTDPESLPYYRAQEAARLDRWAPPPGIPVILAGTPTDEVVRYSNSESAFAWAKENSPEADVALVRLSASAHAKAAVEALLYAIRDIDRREEEFLQANGK